MQLSVAPAVRGRVVGLYMMTLMGGTPLGAPILGWIGETFGARWTLIGGGLATGIAVVAATIWLIRKQDIDLHELSVRPAKIAA